MADHAGRARKWCDSFLNTELEQTLIDTADTAQKAIHDYSGAMGIPTSGYALSDNFGRWCRTLTGYAEVCCEEAKFTTELDLEGTEAKESAINLEWGE